MKKQSIKAFVILCILIIICIMACGKKEVKKINDLECEYISFDETEGCKINQQIVTETMSEEKNLLASVNGDEELVTKKTVKSGKIFGKPDNTSIAIGDVGEGESVSVLAEEAGGNFYKIIYNGRVAYLEITTFGESEKKNTETATEKPKKEPSTGSTSSGGSLGGNSSSSVSSNGGTSSAGNQNIKDPDKKPPVDDQQDPGDTGSDDDIPVSPGEGGVGMEDPMPVVPGTDDGGSGDNSEE